MFEANLIEYLTTNYQAKAINDLGFFISGAAMLFDGFIGLFIGLSLSSFCQWTNLKKIIVILATINKVLLHGQHFDSTNFIYGDF